MSNVFRFKVSEAQLSQEQVESILSVVAPMSAEDQAQHQLSFTCSTLPPLNSKLLGHSGGC